MSVLLICRRIYWQHREQIEACKKGRFKIIQIDATYMINEKRWPLTLIMCIDVDGRHRLLAQMLSCSEKHADINWMLSHFKDSFDCQHVEAVLTDRAQNYTEPVKQRFPNAKHIYCIYHILSNIRRQCRELGLSERSEEVEKLFVSCVYASSEHDFNVRRRKLYENILAPLLRTTDSDRSDTEEPTDSRSAASKVASRSANRIKGGKSANIHNYSDTEEEPRSPTQTATTYLDDEEQVQEAGENAPEWWQTIQLGDNSTKPESSLVFYLINLFKLKEHFAGYMTSDVMLCGAWSSQAIESLHHALKWSTLRDLKSASLARIVELVEKFIKKKERQHSWTAPAAHALESALKSIPSSMYKDLQPWLDFVAYTCQPIVVDWAAIACVDAFCLQASRCELQDVKAVSFQLPTRLQQWVDDCEDQANAAATRWYFVRPKTRAAQRPRVVAFNTRTGAYRCNCHTPTRAGRVCKHFTCTAMADAEVFLLLQHIHHRYWRETPSKELAAYPVVRLQRGQQELHAEPCGNYEGNYPIESRFVEIHTPLKAPVWDKSRDNDKFEAIAERSDKKRVTTNRRSGAPKLPYQLFRQNHDTHNKPDKTIPKSDAKATARGGQQGFQKALQVSKPRKTTREPDKGDEELEDNEDADGEYDGDDDAEGARNVADDDDGAIFDCDSDEEPLTSRAIAEGEDKYEDDEDEDADDVDYRLGRLTKRRTEEPDIPANTREQRAKRARKAPQDSDMVSWAQVCIEVRSVDDNEQR